MAAERIQTSGSGYYSYDADRTLVKRRRRLPVRPVEAIMFDRVDLSGEQPETATEYAWLTTSIARMSDEVVSRKMKKYRDSFPTIDDALADKIIMEAI